MALEWSDWSSDTGGGAQRSGGAASPTAGLDARERHKLAERERRKSMRELFLSLHALLPYSNTVRKEQSAILDEIINPAATTPPPPAAAAAAAAADTVSSSSTVTDAGSGSSGDCSIRVAPEPSSSVSIRVRGDRVNVSLTDTKVTSQSLLLSAVLDELVGHNLELVRSTHCRDGSKVLHHSESKICDGLELSPVLLKSRLQELACRLHKLRKTSSNLKRSFDQIA
ncbi:hypothetical protein Sjap_012823 [Stephania japonica]|uniref:BHLH domain-containing protein n=1 Tax=Stephania japonica TaxID=461633 RepID=A0AAP0P0S1_9MAGN